MPYPQTLTGGQLGLGTSTDNTGTDIFDVTGLNNTAISGAGNLTVQGFTTLPPVSVTDSRTTVILNANKGTVNDLINLNGQDNVIYMNGVGSPGEAHLTGGSTVNVTVSQSALPVSEASGGNNYVNLFNDAGTTNVTLSGPANTVILNGHANNTVDMTGTLSGSAGGSTVVIGGPVTEASPQGPIDDDLFTTSDTWGSMNTAKITLSDSYNTVITGDENTTVTGGSSHNSIAVGDGTNSITLTGGHNSIDVGGGFNTIDTGSGNATVLIQGADHSNLPPAAGDNDGLPSNPKDKVTLRGGNNKVFANYEDVFVNNIDSTSSGGDLIILGNGNNAINEFGNSNTMIVGDGINTVDSQGNNDLVIVQDPTGVGTDTVTLDSGTNNLVSLDHAAGAVSAVGLDSLGNITTNTVVQAGTNDVSVNFQTGTGNISLGDGNDTVTANGANDTVALGSGNNVVMANGANTIVGITDKAGATENVTANGNGAIVVVGNGNDTVTANGSPATVVAGNGNDTVTANGNGALIFVGSGNDTISATGTGDHVTISASSTSLDSTTLGSGDVLRATNGTQTITGGSNDTILLNATNVNSTATLSGSADHVFVGSNGSDRIYFDPAQSNSQVTVQAFTAGIYTGTVEVTGFSTNSTLDLESLTGKNGLALNTYANVLSNLSASSGTQYVLALQGGGAIKLDTTVAFQASEFAFTNGTGAV